MVEIMPGGIVRSKAGRDKGGFFMVLRREGNFAYLADGKRRRLASPKRKRIKHLAPTAARLDADSITTDKQLKRLLTNYNQAGNTACDTGGHELV